MSDMDFEPTMAFRGLESLNVRLHPRLVNAV
jgi:hypothetical protein